MAQSRNCASPIWNVTLTWWLNIYEEQHCWDGKNVIWYFVPEMRWKREYSKKRKDVNEWGRQRLMWWWCSLGSILAEMHSHLLQFKPGCAWKRIETSNFCTNICSCRDFIQFILIKQYCVGVKAHYNYQEQLTCNRGHFWGIKLALIRLGSKTDHQGGTFFCSPSPVSSGINGPPHR